MSSPLSRSGLRREQSVFALSSPDVATISSGSLERVALETEVLELLLSEELVPEQAATSEVRWFFRNLGLHSAYFHAQPASKIAEHVLALYASKLLAACSGSESSVLSLRLKHETAEGALYIVPSTPGADSSPSEMVERRIEAFYYDEPYAAFALEDLPPFLLPTAVPPVASSSPSTPFSPSTKASPTSHAGYRCAIYRTGGTVSPTSEARLRLMLVQRIFDSLSPELEQETDLRKVAAPSFFTQFTPAVQSTVQEMLLEAMRSLGPVIRVNTDEQTTSDEQPSLYIMYRKGSAHSMLSGLTLLYHAHGLYSQRKFVETLANGFVVHILHLSPRSSSHHAGQRVSGTGTPVASGSPFVVEQQPLAATESNTTWMREQIQLVAEEAALMYALPRTSLTHLLKHRVFTKSQECYAYSLWKLSYHFLSSFGSPDLSAISASLDTKSRGMLVKLSEGFKRDGLTEARVLQAVEENADIVKQLYADFEMRLSPSFAAERAAPDAPALARQRQESLRQLIRRSVASELDGRILTAMSDFNAHILKTNFFKASKLALSFRLDPAFLSSQEYAVRPFAIFFVVGAEFRGFHVRFVDIARGGIRIIQSRNAAAFAINVATVFDENYNLAYTQQNKNKDIPEGGSKGTILLSREHQDKQFVAFRKYVDSLLDLILPHPDIVDLYGKTELLFLGPDEGTADMMGWASSHSQARGYSFYRSFTTGKPPALGGIPHDTYGMTTRSVHSYVLGILNKLGIDERRIKKLQTGGPDGDLGSNEILISHDQTVAVVDGSGVLYDPNGIDRTELQRLARLRQPCSFFDKSKLSSAGFLVLVDEHDITLPDGRLIDSGVMFRNGFHLEQELLRDVELFVPCGGRPAAVNASNVQLLWDDSRAAPRFKYIVEGANLFFTQEARLKLEEWGVVLIKDASANKGGVTSSSLEVLAALALSDDEFASHMQVPSDADAPAFYRSYVADVQAIIQDRATLEFEALWSEHQRTKRPMCILTDELSSKINDLTDQISRSSLWSNRSLRAAIITRAVPPTLLALLGIDTILTRVPEPYLQAIFGSYIACRFVYSRGLAANNEIEFFEFLSAFINESK